MADNYKFLQRKLTSFIDQDKYFELDDGQLFNTIGEYEKAKVQLKQQKKEQQIAEKEFVEEYQQSEGFNKAVDEVMDMKKEQNDQDAKHLKLKFDFIEQLVLKEIKLKGGIDPQL